MKKLITLTLCALLALSLVACSSNGGNNGGAGAGDSMALSEIVEKLYEGVPADNMPALMNQELTADLFEGVLFIPAIDGAEAYMSEPMMSSIAHSVALLRLPEGSDVEAVRAEIEKNMNPVKWCCVEAEKSSVVANGNTILLCMSFTDMHDTVVDNFNALWK